MAVDLARLGAPFPVALAGVVGADDHGRLVLDECAAVGVGTGGIRVTTDAATSFTDAMVLKGSGLRTNLELVGLDAVQLRDLVRPCLPHLDYLVVNEVEAAAVAGVEVTAVGADGAVDWAGIETAARGCLDLGVARLVVVHFPTGALAVAADGTVHRHGSVRLPPEVIRNATGAGDAFAAGVVLGPHDLPVEECLRLGVCAAAANLQGAGTSDGVLPAADCLALGATYGYRDPR